MLIIFFSSVFLISFLCVCVYRVVFVFCCCFILGTCVVDSLGEDYTRRSFMLYTLYQILFLIKLRTQTDRACSTYEGEESSLESFGGET
jgi:hypothetical protein